MYDIKQGDCCVNTSCVFLLQHGLLSHALRLAHNCLTFDFIGTSTDESSDDLCTVQIPTSWRSGTAHMLFFPLDTVICVFVTFICNMLSLN